MKLPYHVERGQSALPSLGGSLLRPRPVIPVLVSGPASKVAAIGLLDTGADETVFPETLAAQMGIDLARAEERKVGLAARSGPLRCRYAGVELEITDGQETFQWRAVVGFVPVRLTSLSVSETLQSTPSASILLAHSSRGGSMTVTGRSEAASEVMFTAGAEGRSGSRGSGSSVVAESVTWSSDTVGGEVHRLEGWRRKPIWSKW